TKPSGGSVLVVAPDPETDQMAAALGLGMSLEGRAVVQNPAVVDEEDLARLEGEFRPQIGAREKFIQKIEGPDLFVRQGHTRLVVSLVNPVAQVADQQFLPVDHEDGKLRRG